MDAIHGQLSLLAALLCDIKRPNYVYQLISNASATRIVVGIDCQLLRHCSDSMLGINPTGGVIAKVLHTITEVLGPKCNERPGTLSPQLRSGFRIPHRTVVNT